MLLLLTTANSPISDPLFQQALVNVVRRSSHLFGTAVAGTQPPQGEQDWTGLPVIFDEVFTGLYRLGRFSASSFLGVQPDISVHAKLLTGGLLPLCTTLASESIFDAFKSGGKTDALLHGHSYTAHAIGCEVARQSILELKHMDERGQWDWAKAKGGWAFDTGETMSQASVPSTPTGSIPWSVWSRQFIDWLSRQSTAVDGVWALGSVLAIHMRSSDGLGYNSNAARDIQSSLYQLGQADENREWNVHSRVLGNVLYIMTSQATRAQDVNQLEQALQKAFSTRS
jgi:dethiobiotin synthetase/adenosylmethionine--8-amino-7-oxononanoate aminotransferase